MKRSAMVFRTPLKFFVPSNKDHENTDMSSTESLNLNEIRSSLPNPTVNLEMVRQFSIWLNKSIEIMTRYVTKFKSRSVNAAVLLTRAVILRIVFKTGIILSMKKTVSKNDQPVSKIPYSPPPNILASNDPRDTQRWGNYKKG